MLRRIALPVAVLLSLAACEQHAPLTEPSLEADVPGVQAAVDQMSDGTYMLLAKGNQLGAVVADVEALGGTVTFRHDGIGFAVVSGLDAAAAASLEAHGDVTNLVADEVIALEEPEMDGTAAAEVASPGDPTTASRYPQQWNLHAVQAADAWAAGRTGSEDVSVAILDTGIDYLYPDLVGRVDLSRSVSFLPADDAEVEASFPGAHPIADLHYHGTHVASTVSSNAYVVAAIASEVTLIGVKVCSIFGGCPNSAIFAGILHATDVGADVINMSLGGAFLKQGSQGYHAFIHRVFQYASKAGVTVVVSAGNDAADLDRNYFAGTHYPTLFSTYCDTPSVVCVSATGPTAGGTFTTGPWTDVDAPAYYTNFGRNAINVAAPGGNFGASVVGACSGFSLLIPVCQTGVFVVGLGGTSMAAPHVSSLAALLVEDYGRNASRIKNQLQQSADDLGQSGADPYYGKGRINVAEALDL